MHGLVFTDTVAYWSVDWTPGQEVWVQDLAGSMCCVLGQNTVIVQCLSPPRSVNGCWKIIRETWWNAGGNPGERSYSHSDFVPLWKLRQAQAVWASRFEYRRYSDLAFCSLGNLTVVKWYCYNVSLNYLPIVPFILNSQYPLLFMAFFKFWSSVWRNVVWLTLSTINYIVNLFCLAGFISSLWLNCNERITI